MKIAVAEKPTPILNVDDFDEAYGVLCGSLMLNQRYFFTPLEMIAFEGTIFKVIKEVNELALEVSLDSYPTSYPLYIDRRLVQISEELTQQKQILLPSKKEIIKKMRSCIGMPYLWGGNTLKPLQYIENLYPIHQLSFLEQKMALCEGIDCSGLIYAATNGFTPRNTSELVNFGSFVDIEGKKPEEIELKPLDLLVYKGHVMIAIDHHEVIQSKEKFGCYTTKSRAILRQLLKKYKASNSWNTKEDLLVVKRWFTSP